MASKPDPNCVTVLLKSACFPLDTFTDKLVHFISTVNGILLSVVIVTAHGIAEWTSIHSMTSVTLLNQFRINGIWLIVLSLTAVSFV
jgi:hypothetical protein